MQCTWKSIGNNSIVQPQQHRFEWSDYFTGSFSP